MNPATFMEAQPPRIAVSCSDIPTFNVATRPVWTQYDPDAYWDNTEGSYPHYPTVRHRKRFIINTIRKGAPKKLFTVFDFGCGEASLLQSIQTRFDLPDDALGGCDISDKAVLSARKKLKTPYLYHALFPVLPMPFDIMVCSEVIEHTTEYRDILVWMHRNLVPGGLLILSTQTGTIHGSDRYTGHTQHFQKKELVALLRATGYRLEKSYLWGWPLFTLQKCFTDICFEHIQKAYLEGSISLRKKFVFDLAYTAYFLHDLIPFGPQMYIIARKS